MTFYNLVVRLFAFILIAKWLLGTTPLVFYLLYSVESMIICSSFQTKDVRFSFLLAEAPTLSPYADVGIVKV